MRIIIKNWKVKILDIIYEGEKRKSLPQMYWVSCVIYSSLILVDFSQLTSFWQKYPLPPTPPVHNWKVIDIIHSTIIVTNRIID